MKKIENNQINLKNIHEKVELYGWVSKKRNLGGVVFIDLRDRSGIIQLLIKPENDYYSLATNLKNESVVRVIGVVKERENKNSKLDTGDIEVEVQSLELLNTSCELPFEISDDTSALEDTRLKYRYLDLRRPSLKNNLIIRHKIMMATRNFLAENGFYEIETPILCKSTPEGARDYLVPSRINRGNFYALPQSPQLFKQLLMIGGFEKYFQIAKCFRDEDLRADRQPEFTQIDVEMSFVDENDVIDLGERLIQRIFKEVKNIDIKLPLRRMKYDKAICDYGTDKPDLRFDMKIQDITEILKNTNIPFFQTTLNNHGIINCLVAKNATCQYSRKEIDKLTEFVKTYNASGLAYLKIDDTISGSIAKGLTDQEIEELITYLKLETKDLVLIVCGKRDIVKTSLGALRCKIAKDLDLIANNSYELLWVTDFPVFEYSQSEGRFLACHHPFTAPKEEDVDKLLTDKEHCYAKAYDIVINGYEAGGGSIRIHDPEIQKKMFQSLGFDEEQAKEKFGFFLEAFQYGTPPHGGFACGLDRLTMLFAQTDNIRDVIAFPKTASASCLMSGCPNVVDEKQLKELGIQIER